MRCLNHHSIVFFLTGCILLGLAASAPAAYKRFTDSNTPLIPVSNCGLAWGDYDNDGDVDLALSGSSKAGYGCKIYRNDGGGTFTDANVGIAEVSAALAWADYDKDGDLDLALAGYISKIYRNDGGGIFTDIAAGLPEVPEGCLAWGDYDNDGDSDLAIAGGYDPNTVSKIYRNDGSETFTDISAGLQAVGLCSLAWGDYDNDGDLDLALAGITNFSGQTNTAKIYRNDGGGTFTDIGAGLTGMCWCSLAWGDYDNDGDLDLVITGYRFWIGAQTEIYRNDGGGTFTETGAGLRGAHRSSVAWGDYDNDGDLDLAIAGHSETAIYRNDGGTFKDIDAGLIGMITDSVWCELAWGDYDNDGDLDLAVSGLGNPTDVSKIYRNDCEHLIGDMNGDCYVNFQDFALFSEYWLQCSHELDPNCVQ